MPCRRRFRAEIATHANRLDALSTLLNLDDTIVAQPIAFIAPGNRGPSIGNDLEIRISEREPPFLRVAVILRGEGCRMCDDREVLLPLEKQ
jgi:hypothetical protein